MAIKVHPSFAVHPGLWLSEEIVGPCGRTIGEVAAALHVSRPNMSRLLNGHAALSTEMALRFEKAFGLSADTLMRMQTAHDMAKAREHEADLHVDRIVEPV